MKSSVFKTTHGNDSSDSDSEVLHKVRQSSPVSEATVRNMRPDIPVNITQQTNLTRPMPEPMTEYQNQQYMPRTFPPLMMPQWPPYSG